MPDALSASAAPNSVLLMLVTISPSGNLFLDIREAIMRNSSRTMDEHEAEADAINPAADAEDVRRLRTCSSLRDEEDAPPPAVVMVPFE